MVAVVLGISVLGVMLWGLIDKKSLRKLSISTRIGIFTYLLALVAFSIGEFLTGQNEIKEISQIIGIVLAIYTVFVLFNRISKQIDKTQMGNLGCKFWKAVIGASLFSILETVLFELFLTPDIRNYSLIIVAGIAGLFWIFAGATVIVLLFKTLFPPKNEDED